ncbi:MAG: class I SAM-dependent methyltransferase [Longicatena sp.]
MFNEDIWQDPATKETLIYSESKHVLKNESKTIAYTIDENDIVDFIAHEERDTTNTTPITKKLKNPFSNDKKTRASYLQYLELWPGEYALEVSVGDGANIRTLPLKSVKFVGIDANKANLRKASELMKDSEQSITLCHGDAEALPFQDDVFTCVFHDGNHTPFKDMKKAIQEMVRVTSPEGKIVIMSKNIAGDGIVDALPSNVRTIETHDVPKGKCYVVTCYKK